MTPTPVGDPVASNRSVRRPPIAGRAVPADTGAPAAAGDPPPPGDIPLDPSGTPVPRPALLLNLTVIIMLGTALSRILGLVRESVVSSRFGAGNETDAFTLADNVQSTVFELTSNGVLQAAMIPALAGLMVSVSGGVPAVRRAMGALMSLILAATLTLTVAGMVWAPAVVRLLTGLFDVGDPPTPATIELTVELVRWILPAVPLLGLASVLMAGLHVAGRPAAPSFGSATRNLVFIAVAVVASAGLGVRSLALGTVLGSAAIVLLQLPALRRAGLLVWPSLRLNHPVVGTVVRLSVPVTAGLIVSTGVMIVDRNLASGVSEGTVAVMRFATTLTQTVLGLVAAAVALAALPSLSRHHEADDDGAFAATLGRALTFVTVLIVPATVLLAALSSTVVRLVFQRGETTGADAGDIQLALLGYLPGTVAAAYAQVLLFAFYARRDTLTPLLITLAGAAGYTVAAFAMVEPLGLVGLVLANSVQWSVTLLGVLVLGHRSVRAARAIPWPVVGVSLLASIVAAAVCAGIDRALGSDSADSGDVARLTSLSLAAVVSLTIYPVLLVFGLRRTGVEIEMPDRLAAVVGRFRGN